MEEDNLTQLVYRYLAIDKRGRRMAMAYVVTNDLEGHVGLHKVLYAGMAQRVRARPRYLMPISRMRPPTMDETVQWCMGIYGDLAVRKTWR